MAATVTINDQHTRITLNFLQEVLGDYHPRDFAVRMWDGTVWEAEPGQPTRFVLVLNHPGALRKMFLPPSDLSIGEAFIYEDFDVEGDLHDALSLAENILNRKWPRTDLLRYGVQLLRLPTSNSNDNDGRHAAELSGGHHSIERDREAVRYHYNVSNDFYALWLDKNMVYSCGYFTSPDDDLDAAQEQKLDYICRKLRLKPGERLLDIGCGWGGLIIHAARHYGVEATGITLSEAQAELANERIRAADLQEHCRVEVRDYREMEGAEQYDKLVSVGMFEHVGEKMLPAYFEQAWSLLRPGGVFLNHGIGRHIKFKQKRQSFMNRYVFPDGELVPLSTTTRIAEETGFEVRDVESLREHYALTLNHWLRRLEANEDKALRHVHRATFRTWRIYLFGSEHSFNTQVNNLYQVLLSKPDGHDAHLPLTREDWYSRS